jgi:hypothetical protein
LFSTAFSTAAVDNRFSNGRWKHRKGYKVSSDYDTHRLGSPLTPQGGLWESMMRTLVESIYLNSTPGELTELAAAGTTLENPYVYDSAARELKTMAEKGLVRIVREEHHVAANDTLIARITFARLR